MLFSIVLVALAVPLGIVLFDHPLIVLLPLSATRLQSKNLEDEPSDRRQPGSRPGPGDPGAGASLLARPVAKLLPIVALLVFAGAFAFISIGQYI
jgi:hypothetical protein